MKLYLTICLFLSISCSSLAGGGNSPLPVLNPDIPDNGWLWSAFDGGESGWAINLEIQPGDISTTGHFAFLAFYTYDENEQPIWYTASGEYVPNNDVYAWREDRGDMGTFTGEIYKSSGGACLICVPKPSDTVENSGLGFLTITWQNPYEATVQIGNHTTHQVSRFEFHNGLTPTNSIDYIKKGWWQVYHQTFGDTDTFGKYRVAKGLVKFEEIDKSFFSGSTFYDDNFKYYINTQNTPISWLGSSFYGSAFVGNELSRYVVVFDPDSNKSMLFYFSGWSEAELQIPSVRGHWLNDRCSVVVEGYFRPSLTNSVFYGRKDSRCSLDDIADTDDARGSMAHISFMGNAGDALLNNGAIGYFGGLD